MPNHPLSAKGLATPWQLGDGCSEANPSEEAFVEATILAPNGQVQIYDPLVITQGTTAAVTPTAPTIPRGSQVIIDVGFNGNNLVLEGAGAFQGACIDAFGNSIIVADLRLQRGGLLRRRERPDRAGQAAHPAAGYRHGRAGVSRRRRASR